MRSGTSLIVTEVAMPPLCCLRMHYASAASLKNGSLTVADVDGDGKLDFAIQALDTMYVLGNGDGTFALPVAKWQNSAFALGDLDGDADLDVVQRSEQGRRRLPRPRHLRERLRAGRRARRGPGRRRAGRPRRPQHR
jgi:hypothetical protein